LKPTIRAISVINGASYAMHAECDSGLDSPWGDFQFAVKDFGQVIFTYADDFGAFPARQRA
jgi:hypothetical protein